MKKRDIINIFDVPINNMTMETALDTIANVVRTKQKAKIYFVNTFYLNTAWENPEYWNVLKQGDYIWGDGSGVRVASYLVGTPIIDNVNGTDMIFPLSAMCQKEKFRIFLLGCKPGVAARLKDWMEERYPGIEVSGHYHGYFDREKERDDIISKINDSNTDILLVGFSAPLQELWIHEHADLLKCPVMIGVGGLFDVYAGDIHRPHVILRKLGLEWFGRLCQEPRRLWKRYLIGNPQFLLRVMRWRYFRAKTIMTKDPR